MLLLCLTCVSVLAGDLSHVSSPTAYSQQSFNIGNYAPSGYANTAYDDPNAYITQDAGYQVQEIATNHVSNAAQQGHFDTSSIDVTHDGYAPSNDFNGGITYGYNTDQQQQSNAFDATQGHIDDYNSNQQTIHTQAETFPISKHVEITKNQPYPVYKQLHVPGN